MDRRTFLRGAIGVAAAGGIAGIADLTHTAVQSRANTSGQLRIGYLPITDAAPLLIAHGEDLYKQGVVSATKPIMFRSWSSLAEAFLSRKVDVVHLLMPMAIQLKYEFAGAARILGWNHTNGSALTVAPDITDLGQLAGRQLAIPSWWSIHNIVIQQLLRAHGLRPVIRTTPSRSANTVGLIVMSPSDMIPALVNGAVGAFTVADPFNAAAELRGVGRIHRFLGDMWRDHACCALLVHESVIEKNPNDVQSLTDSVATAQLRINGNRRAAASMLSNGRYLPQPLPAITKSLTYAPEQYQDRIKHPAWDPQRIGYQPFPFPSYTQSLAEAMHSTVVDGDTGFLSKLDPATAHHEMIDDRFVRESLRRLGGPANFGLPASLTRTEDVDPT